MMAEFPASIELALKRPFLAKARIRPLEGNSYSDSVESSSPTSRAVVEAPPLHRPHKEIRDISALTR
jgi:hypothetical protein